MKSFTLGALMLLLSVPATAQGEPIFADGFEGGWIASTGYPPDGEERWSIDHFPVCWPEDEAECRDYDAMPHCFCFETLIIFATESCVSLTPVCLLTP